MKIATIDIQAKEWFDKVNGNSYHSARITLNFGLEDEKTICVPFTYGYEDHYLQSSAELLEKEGFIQPEKYDNGAKQSIVRYCREHGIDLRTSKQEGCKKRDVVSWGMS